MMKRCGCSTTTCGCCEGVRVVTPVVPDNRPGLPTISYRAGTYSQFFESMKARISTTTIDTDQGTVRPLAGLTTRDSSDPAIALLDSWATAGSVLTFYQERIAKEGYLRTATERRSVLELARLVGYEPRPGVAASVYLAYTLDDNQVEAVLIEPGARSQSIPLTGSTDLPQSFETSDPLVARREWNNLAARTHFPQNIALITALSLDTLYVAGSNTSLKTGDQLLLVFATTPPTYVVRTVRKVTSDFTTNSTTIELLVPDAATALAAPLLATFVATLRPMVKVATQDADARLFGTSFVLLQAAYLGLPGAASTWVTAMNVAVTTSSNELVAVGTLSAAVKKLYDQFQADLANILGGGKGGAADSTTLLEAVTRLTIPRNQQPASSEQLPRTLASSLQKGSDAHSQLLVNFIPEIKETLYTTAASLGTGTAPPALQGVYAFRLSTALFGSSVSDRIVYQINETNPKESDPVPVAPSVDAGEVTNAFFLDQAHEAILPGSYALIQRPTFTGLERSIHLVSATQTVQRTAYGISGKTSKLTLPEDWWFGIQDSIGVLRGTSIWTQTEPLDLIDQPDNSDVSGQEVHLDGVYKELTSGRWVVFSGERTDIPGVKGVQGVELIMISGLRHGYANESGPVRGELLHTTLLLATKTAYSYKRNSLTIYGNVVKATHGETRPELLGSGDASQPLQSFVLRQPPLTYVSAPVASGVASTLAIYVNNIEWQETDTLAGLSPKDRKFITQTDDDGVTTVIFGNGEQGSRLPTGVQNVQASYRNGIGLPGNVNATQISQMQTRPMGAKAVINPLPASGGADKESRDLARQNAPLAVMALDRLVSVQDFADFSRTFAGIAKADARPLAAGRRQIVHVTVAGAGDIRIDPQSDLYRNLLIAMRKAGDPNTPFQVDSRELLILILSARVRIHPDYLWDPVAAQIRANLLDFFGFDRRALGQPALLCEVIAAIQQVPGVIYVDVDSFGGIPEKKTVPAAVNANGKPTPAASVLLMPDDIAHEVLKILETRTKLSDPDQSVRAGIARLENGVLRPAQLAIFTRAVPDTIVLNQIL
jgi:hypothetical protein